MNVRLLKGYGLLLAGGAFMAGGVFSWARSNPIVIVDRNLDLGVIDGDTPQIVPLKVFNTQNYPIRVTTVKSGCSAGPAEVTIAALQFALVDCMIDPQSRSIGANDLPILVRGYKLSSGEPISASTIIRCSIRRNLALR